MKLAVKYIKRKRLDYIHVLPLLMYGYYVSNSKLNNNTLNFLHKFKLIFHCVSVKKLYIDFSVNTSYLNIKIAKNGAVRSIRV